MRIHNRPYPARHFGLATLSPLRGPSEAPLLLQSHFTGATATAMVQTSLLRLMISRLSFGPM